MKSTFSEQLGLSLGTLVLAFSGVPAMAATTWNVDGCSSAALSGTGCGTVGNAVTAAAYSVSNTGSGSKFVSTYLTLWGSGSGLGVGGEPGSPDHALDNNGNTELLAFKFDSAVILDKITLGWTQGDADFSLFAWKGASAPTSTDITNKTLASLKSDSGWSLVGNYANAGGTINPDTRDNNIVSMVNAGNVSSSWWIVSAYNSSYGGTALDSTPDYMKIMAIASKDPVTPPPGGKVPEPGSLALMGIAMAGIVAVRRRKQSDA